MIRICFVCLGNICRSPTAEGVMQHLVEQAGLSDRIHIDSAGTGAYHAGELADPRSRAEARRRGIELRSLARQFVPTDFLRFHYVIPMDRSNLHNLRQLPGHERFDGTLRLLRSFDPQSPPESDMPDPYYGGDDGFAEVFDLCMAGCTGLLEHIREVHAL